jgi:hypothetical protein
MPMRVVFLSLFFFLRFLNSKLCTKMLISTVYYTLVEKCLHRQLLEVFKNQGGVGGGMGERGKATLYLETRKKLRNQINWFCFLATGSGRT